jgi:hypothetical protein
MGATNRIVARGKTCCQRCHAVESVLHWSLDGSSGGKGASGVFVREIGFVVQDQALRRPNTRGMKPTKAAAAASSAAATRAGLALVSTLVAAACGGGSSNGVTDPTTGATVDASCPATPPTIGAVVSAVAGSVCLAGGPSGATYALIPFFSSSVASATASLQFTATGTTAPPPAAASLSAAALEEADPGAATRRFDGELRRRERELTRLFPIARQWQRSTSPAPSFNAIPSTLTPGERIQLNVNTKDNCSNAVFRSGRVVAVTNRAIVIADTANPVGGFTDAEYLSFGTTFDTLVYPMDTRFFGDPSDIDTNGKVVLFFTKAVNDLTAGPGAYVAGFFFGRDLFPLTAVGGLQACGASNVGELVYLMVPDPVRGQSFSKTNVSATTVSTIAHEFQHLINAARRLYVNTTAADFEEIWLNEGLSHIAEELLFYESTKLSPKANLDVTTIRRNQATIDAFNRSQLDNTFRFARYLASPANNSPFAGNDSLATRGAIWSFLRYAADHGTLAESMLWFRLVNSVKSGFANLQEALGPDILVMTRRWSTSILTDDLVSTDALYQQTSWNMRTIIAVLTPETPYPIETIPLITNIPTPVTVAGASAAYLTATAPAGKTATIEWRTLPTGVQISLVRTK